jgi:hypothetical protein
VNAGVLGSIGCSPTWWEGNLKSCIPIGFSDGWLLKGYLVAKLPKMRWQPWQNPFKMEGARQRLEGDSINCQIAKMASLYGKFTSPVYIPHYPKRASHKNLYHSHHIASQEVNGIR